MRRCQIFWYNPPKMSEYAFQMILTTAPESGRIALDELGRYDRDARLLEWLEPGLGLVELGLDWTEFAALVRERPPIFIRHICPVQATLPLDRTPADLDRVARVAGSLCHHLDPERSFSVQTRLLGEMKDWPYGRFELNQRLAAVLERAGAALDVRRPGQVLSVICSPTQAFLGLSTAADNLSDWAGGMRRFKREAGQISRAEFKLLEAVELFDLELPAGGDALDLGAAPGGWTRILRRQAMCVVAVDPADLHPLIASDPAVTHVRRLAQEYLPAPVDFDLVLNDMRLDPRESVGLMLQAAGSLRTDGFAVMTLKLSGRNIAQVVNRSLHQLGRGYRVLGARQLFHNRREVTVALGK